MRSVAAGARQYAREPLSEASSSEPAAQQTLRPRKHSTDVLIWRRKASRHQPDMFFEETTEKECTCTELQRATANERSRRVLGLTLATATASVVLAVLWQSPGHNWGDDFAGYLLQAKALLSGTPAQELELNARTMAASDWRTGPDAYPWGYPALLALVISALGPGLATLKTVSIVSMAVSTLAAGLLAYASRLSLFSVVCVAILVGMQPDLISLANIIGSDAAFLALTGVALLFAALALDEWPNQLSPASRLWATVIAAVFVSLSFFVRSNGAVTLVAIATSIVAVAVFTRRPNLRFLAVSAATFASVCAALIIAYYALLPDGSLVHVGYLTAEPSSLARRAGDAISAFSRFFPIFILPAAFEPVAVAAMAILTVFGACRLGKVGFLLAVYSAGHLLLVILFPYSGGQRYYLPVLFAIVILAAGGVEGLANWVAIGSSRAGDLKFTRRLLVALLFIGAVTSNLFRIDLQRERNIDGPYSPAATELFAYIREQPSEIQPVAFFKPRVLRLLAGKEAVLVREIASTKHVNSIAIFRGEAASPWQLSGREVAALEDFRPTFRNEEFTFYVRKGRTIDAVVADGPGDVRRHPVHRQERSDGR